jgi:putative transcriptional regulator
MDNANYLSNHLLISVPTIDDVRFRNTVILICEHNHEGAMGIIINRPLPSIKLKDIFKDIGINTTYHDVGKQRVFDGGPTQQNNGFILHSPISLWRSTHQINDHLAITTSRDLLTAIANGECSDQFLVALGCANWQAGQLEKELTENIWLVVPADLAIVFNVPPEERMKAAVDRLGFDLARLSPQMGHA